MKSIPHSLMDEKKEHNITTFQISPQPVRPCPTLSTALLLEMNLDVSFQSSNKILENDMEQELSGTLQSSDQPPILFT